MCTCCIRRFDDGSRFTEALEHLSNLGTHLLKPVTEELEHLPDVATHQLEAVT